MTHGANGHDARPLPECTSELANEVWLRYSRRLIDLARRNLSSRIRRKEDPEEVVQSALRSFCRRRDADLLPLGDWESLWRMLMVITLRKCRGRARKYFAQSRDLDRERYLPSGVETDQLLAGGPTPLEAATLADLVENVMAHLLDDRERRMLELALQGHGTAEIAKLVGRSPRTVSRVLSRVRSYLSRTDQDDQAQPESA